LLAHKANLNPQDEDGMTPLMFASIAGKISSVKLLLEKGADKEIRNHAGKTALEEALAHKKDAVANLLK